VPLLAQRNASELLKHSLILFTMGLPLVLKLVLMSAALENLQKGSRWQVVLKNQVPLYHILMH
jgi:cell division inhibitor SulA